MTSFPKWRTALAVIAVAAFMPAGLAAASRESDQAESAPTSSFVNGKSSNAVVYTVCPGPVGPNEFGPPAGGQPVEVQHVQNGGGDTGSTGNVVYSYIPGSPPAITTLHQSRRAW